MALERQSANLILSQGIDTKTNSKLVEGKLLEMENCEINNQQIIKSPGAVSLAEEQTFLPTPHSQKGLANAYNTLVIAESNRISKYSADQDKFHNIENALYSYNTQYNITQNISENLQVAGNTVNQLYAPYFTFGAPFPTGYCLPEPISCQWGIYLFTVVFIATNSDPLTGTIFTGYYQITLTDTSAQTQVYQSTFPFTYTPTSPPGAQQLQVPVDCVATPAGIFMYTVDYAAAGLGQVYEYFMTYDLSIVLMSPSSPNNSTIFPGNPVLIVKRSDVSNLTNYCNFFSVEYSNSFLFIAFRQGTFGAYTGMIAVRDLGSNTLQFPTAYTAPAAITTDDTTKNFCTFIFNYPNGQDPNFSPGANYFAVLFGNQYRIILCADGMSFPSICSFTSSTSSGYSTHSMGFLQGSPGFSTILGTSLVVLLHDIQEFYGTAATASNQIAPTINAFQLIQNADLSLTATQTLSGTGSDPRRVQNSYGTSAIAGRVICTYSQILIPIFYFAYLDGTDANTPPVTYFTPFSDRRNSVHMMQFVDTMPQDIQSPLVGLTNILNHVSWVKDYSCSLYNAPSNAPNPNRGVPPAVMRSKIAVTDNTGDNTGCFIGFYVETQQISVQGQVKFTHQLNAYHLQIPYIFDFQGFARSSFYMGSGKMYELTPNTISEMGFFDFPQMSIGSYVTPAITPQIANGQYLYNAYYEWTNGNGELVRSAVTQVEYTLNVPDGGMMFTGATSIDIFLTPEPFFSNKLNAVTRIFRSTINGNVPFFEGDLPITTTLPMFSDTFSDEDIENNTLVYTYGNVLEDFPFAGITAFTLYKNSVFAINSNDRNQIQYSKTREPGIAMATTNGFSFTVDTRDGDCTFVENMDDKLIIFKANSIYVVEGDIPDNSGNNSTLTPPQYVTSPVGCNQPNSVVVFPSGIIFKSKKGIWQLDRSLNSKYIGADVEAYNNLTVTSAQPLTTVNKVKFHTLEGTVLTYDYYYNAWDIETFPYGFLDSSILNDSLVSINVNGLILQEDPSIYLRNGQNYSMKFTTGWIKLAGLTGFQRLYKIMFLGNYIGNHVLKASVAYDYDNEPSEFHYFNPSQDLGVFNAFEDLIQDWGDVTPYAGYADSTYLFRINVRQQKCVSVRITIEDLFTGTADQTGASFTATNINFDIGVKSNTAKVASRLQT